MNSLQIKNFLTVVKCGSLSKAAEELNVSQPTLSKSISALERELDIRLFHREYHKLTLTMSGERLYEFFYNANEEFAQLYEDIHPKENAGEVLRIGILGEIKISSLNRSIHELRDAHPELEIRLYLTATEQLLHEFENDRFDIMVLFDMMPGLEDQYEKVPLEEVPMMLLYSNIYFDQPTVDSFRDECYLYVSYTQEGSEEFSVNLQKALWEILGFRPKRQKAESSFQELQMELACGTGYWIATKTDENARSKDISGLELDIKTNLIAVCKTKKHSKYLKELQEIYRQNLTE